MNPFPILLIPAMALAVALPAQTNQPPAPTTQKQDTTPKSLVVDDEIPADKDPKTHPSSVKYSILRAGAERRPTPGDQALVRYWEWLADGTLIDSTGKRGGQPVLLNVGDPQIPFAMSLGPQLIGKGGTVKLTVPPERAYGRAGQVGRIPPDSTMVYVIELVEWVYRPKQARFIQGDAKKTKATDSGVKYQVLEAGKGANPGPNDIVELEFTAWTMAGQVILGTFQHGQTQRAPITALSHPFFKEILPMMKTGGVWRIVAPQDATVPQLQEDTVWQLKLVSFEKPPAMPTSNKDKSTSTKSGLYYERLTPGTGDRPQKDYICEVEFAFWKKDGTFVASSEVMGSVIPVVVGREEHHKFLDEVVQLMQVGEVIRVEVPDKMTPPRMMRFDTVWRLKLLSLKKPLPTPEFQMPKDAELTKTASGLKYKVLEQGDPKGALASPGQLLTIHYAGWTTDGKLFDSSYRNSQPVQIPLGRVPVMKGWEEGLQLMRPGDAYLFVVPSELAFGARGTPDGVIPPDATVVFQIRLIKAGQ